MGFWGIAAWGSGDESVLFFRLSGCCSLDHVTYSAVSIYVAYRHVQIYSFCGCHFRAHGVEKVDRTTLPCLQVLFPRGPKSTQPNRVFCNGESKAHAGAPEAIDRSRRSCAEAAKGLTHRDVVDHEADGSRWRRTKGRRRTRADLLA